MEIPLESSRVFSEAFPRLYVILSDGYSMKTAFEVLTFDFHEISLCQSDFGYEMCWTSFVR